MMRINYKRIPTLVLLLTTFFVLFSGVFSITNTASAEHCPVGQVHDGEGGCEDPLASMDDGSDNNADNDDGGFWAGIGEALLKPIAKLALFISSVFLWMGGTALNLALSFSIIHFKDFVDATGAIQAGWTVIRDVINMSFIFILLYISISTILGKGQNMKKLLGGVVLVALTINFSFFMTSVIIDASNIVALQFYKPLAPEIQPSNGEFDSEDITKADGGLSNVFMGAVKAASSFEPGTNFDEIGSGANVLENNGDGAKLADADNFILISFMGAIFLMILAFIFFAGAILFVIRMVVLMLLLVFSPVAFVGFLLPQGKAASQMWWKNMTDQAIFAPVFMILMYLVARIVTSDSFETMSGGAASLSDAFLGQGDNIVIILNFVIVCAFAIAAIVISKNFAGKAGNFAYGAAGKATFGVAGWAGRNTLGRGGRVLAQSGVVGDLTTSNSRFARGVGNTLLYGGNKLQKSSFDARGTKGFSATGVEAGKAGGKGGFEKTTKDSIKAKKERIKERGSRASSETEKSVREEERNVSRAANKIDAQQAGEAREKHSKKEDAEKKRDDKQQEIDDIQNTMQQNPNMPQDQLDKLADDKRKAEAELAKLERSASEAANSFQNLSNDQKGYANAVSQLDKLNKKAGAEKKANLEFLTENVMGGMPRTQTTIEAARDLRKGKSAEDDLVEAAKRLASEQQEAQGSEGTEQGNQGNQGGQTNNP